MIPQLVILTGKSSSKSIPVLIRKNSMQSFLSSPQLVIISGKDIQDSLYMGNFFTWLDKGLANFDKSVLQPVYRNPAINKVVVTGLTALGTLLSPLTGGISLAVGTAAASGLKIAQSAQGKYRIPVSIAPAAPTTPTTLTEISNKKPISQNDLLMAAAAGLIVFII